MSEHLQIPGRYYRTYPPRLPLGEREELLTIDVAESAFQLIDVYGNLPDDEVDAVSDASREHRSPDHDLREQMIRTKIVPAKEAAKAAGLRIAYVSNYLSPGLSEASEWRNLSARTAGVDVLDTWAPPTPLLQHASIVAPQADEPVIHKQNYNGFFETHLESLLRGWGARNLVIVGFDTLICLAATATEAMYRNYRVIVLRDATYTPEYPETREGSWANFVAVRLIETSIGYTATCDDFIRSCRESVSR